MDEDVEVWDDEDGEDRVEHPVFDMETFRVRLMAKRCTTCIFRPGNLMHLQPGRVKEMVEGSIARQGHVVCHDTLSFLPEGLPSAVCRGFEQHPQGAAHSLALQLARGTGRVTLVHADGRLEDVDYRTLPPYKESDDD